MAVATEFYCKRIGTQSNAPTHMENFEKIGDHLMLPIVFGPERTGRECFRCGIICCCCWGLTIPENFKAVVAIHGEQTGVWEAGFHFAPPWVTLPFLIPERPFSYYTPVSCTTTDGVKITIVPSIVVQVDTSPGEAYDFAGLLSFVNKLGAHSLSPQLNAILEECFIETVKTLPYYETCGFIDGQLNDKLEEAMNHLNEHFEGYGIVLSKLSIKKMSFDDPYSVKGRAQIDESKARSDGNSKLRSKYQRVLNCMENNEREKRAKKRN